MKQQKMIAKQIQKGVKFYYKEVPDLYHDKKTAYDIDVDDNVKELIIPTDLKMNNTKKSFPSVKKLIINALVVDIQIPNSLFPNVKRVVSKSKYFDTCFEYSSVLMRNTFGFWTLLNTFCKEEGEEIDLQDVIAINDFAFQGCKSTRIKSPDITLNEGLSNIIQGAFAGTYIEKVYIPGSVKKIGDEAFSTCHNLKEINFGNGVQQLGNYVFSWNEKLTKIELPPSLQEVGGYAFYKSNIKSITLNEGLSNIVQGAFVGTHIEKLYIPGSVKHIGKGAISENTKEIIMPVFLEDILQGIRRTEKINHFDHTSHIVRLQCGDKYAYLPRYVDISKFANLTKTVTDFFTDVCEGRPELWKYAEDTIDKEDLAILEYYDFNAKEAKEYLKRNAKIFALRLIQNKDEERLAKLLKMNIASNQLLKLLLEEAGETMPTARAYILEMLGNTKTNKSFSI